jgi:hypothetical protein
MALVRWLLLAVVLAALAGRGHVPWPAPTPQSLRSR